MNNVQDLLIKFHANSFYGSEIRYITAENGIEMLLMFMSYAELMQFVDIIRDYLTIGNSKVIVIKPEYCCIDMIPIAQYYGFSEEALLQRSTEKDSTF